MTIAEIVRKHVSERPFLVEALGSGIVNNSALARSIQRERRLGRGDYTAIKAAVTRLAGTRRGAGFTIEDHALAVLGGNRVTLVDRVAVFVSREKRGFESLAEVVIGGNYVYLMDEGKAVSLAKRHTYSRLERNCACISIHSDINIEGVSGVISFLTTVLAEHGINIIQLISCYTETMIVVGRTDALPCYKIISDIVK